jgi:hypothetical protein
MNQKLPANGKYAERRQVLEGETRHSGRIVDTG